MTPRIAFAAFFAIGSWLAFIALASMADLTSGFEILAVAAVPAVGASASLFLVRETGRALGLFLVLLLAGALISSWAAVNLIDDDVDERAIEPVIIWLVWLGLMHLWGMLVTACVLPWTMLGRSRQT